MSKPKHLWAIGYDDMGQANHVRDELNRLGHHVSLLDVAVVVRHPDGSFTFDREPLPVVTNIATCTTLGIVVGLVLAAPLLGATVGALIGGVGTLSWALVGIADDFVRDVKGLMKPGTSALFVLDYGGDMDVILGAIRGLGGTVLKTNVDVERAQLIQSTLASSRPGNPTGSCGAELS